MDKDRIIKRTQLKRNAFKVCGKKIEDSVSQNELISGSSAKDRHLKDYDEEIFDDQDFYNQLLRELIDRKSSCLSDPIELSRRSIELQKLRANNKKKVDTKASKGRKIKFDTHKALVNFMAPIYRMKMPEEARLIFWVYYFIIATLFEFLFF
jgi:protein AATF/BFR2